MSEYIDIYLLDSFDYSLVSVTPIHYLSLGSLLKDLSIQNKAPIQMFILDKGSKILMFRSV